MRKVAKRSIDKTDRQVLRHRTKPKKLQPIPAVQVITPKPSPSILDAKVVEAFSLADFVEMAAAAGLPYPLPMPNWEPNSDASAHGVAIEAWNKANAAARDAAVERVLEHPRFGTLRGSILGAPRDYFARDVVRSDFAGFLNSTAELFVSLADRKPWTLYFGTSTFLPIAEIEGGRLAVAWSAMQANPVPALFSRLASLLDGADAVRIRRCAFEKCRRVFYARRQDSMCCSARCNNCRLQREWYQRHGKSAKYGFKGEKKEHGR